MKRPSSPPCRVRILATLALCAGVALSGCQQTAPQNSAKTGRTPWLRQWRTEARTWRGMHLSARNDEQLEQLLQTLPRFKHLGVNAVILEVDYNFRFQTHPELCAGTGISAERAHEVAKAARALGIRLIPQLNCLGHQSWASHTDPLLTHYPAFDETPGQFPDNKGIYCRSWCPLNPEVNRVVFALIDELIDAFEADAFHVGMDEVFLIGSEYCPRCHGMDPAKLFAKCVNDLHGHIVGKRRLEMLMWGDRFLPAQALGYSKWEASMNGTAPAGHLVPKDIILCDWHYLKQQDYPSLAYLAKKGFRVWPASWQPLDAAQAFSDFARRQNDKKVIGFLCTTWGKVSIEGSPDWPPVHDVLPQWK